MTTFPRKTFPSKLANYPELTQVNRYLIDYHDKSKLAHETGDYSGLWRDINKRTVARFKKAGRRDWEKWGFLKACLINNVPIFSVDPTLFGVTPKKIGIWSATKMGLASPFFMYEDAPNTVLGVSDNYRINTSTAFMIHQLLGRNHKLSGSAIRSSRKDKLNNLHISTKHFRYLYASVKTSTQHRFNLVYLHFHPRIFLELELMHTLWEVYLHSNPSLLLMLNNGIELNVLTNQMFYMFFTIFYEANGDFYRTIQHNIRKVLDINDKPLVELIHNSILYQDFYGGYWR